MKRFLILFAIAFCQLPMVNGQTQTNDLQYLTASYNNKEKSIELASIHKITFENSNVVITTSAGQVLLPVSEMNKLYFSSTATAVENLKDKSTNIQFTSGVLHAKGNGLLRIFSAGGQLQRMANVQGSITISLNNLPHGIYIVQLGEETIKIQK